ncbi:LytR/AlgR family response regulator transcription factor [Ichthyenterobacterium magnum]|uniref:LytTR family two component transcriptional regulator n=1 Tax=Ichthyenterobacterium magnum TaxID=1230530 RepID=A0A420DGR8_9FLAO|nr:LytTR family DNA-binding domain-containing protein [Ichthyenterobacterium magnum]RKE92285.1 LytTR family two component transcriptional regulator [Ichthyenterobacterium magnum]
MDLRAVIIEDEENSRKILKNILEEFCINITVVGMADEVQEAVSVISKEKPDVVFLDIEIKSGTGFDVLNLLPNFNFEVIFTTAFDQYAIKAMKFSSLDYLLKPIDLDELHNAIEKARKRKNQELYRKQLENLMYNLKQEKPKLNKICLSTSDGLDFIEVDTILYCKASGSYTSFVLENKKEILVSRHLKEYVNLFIDHDFMRVHNSFLVNLKNIDKFVRNDGGYIIMKNGDRVNISRSKKDEFVQAMNLLIGN